MRAERLRSKYGESVLPLQTSIRLRAIKLPTGYWDSFETAPVNGRLLFRFDAKK